MNFSAGLSDIEFVLNVIANTKSKELRKDFEKYKEEACWYLIPQLVYINICYNVTARVYYYNNHMVYFSPAVHSNSLSDVESHVNHSAYPV